MAQTILDASAVLALVLSKPGAAHVEGVITDSLISAVNESEVMSRLIWGGESSEGAKQIVDALPYAVVVLDRDLAFAASALWKPTRSQGLSLGDRCCLALAQREKLPVLTADTSWKDVTVGVEINLIAGRRGKQ